MYRRGVALRGLKRFDMAISAFAQGMEQDAGRKPQLQRQGLDGSVVTNVMGRPYGLPARLEWSSNIILWHAQKPTQGPCLGI